MIITQGTAILSVSWVFFMFNLKFFSNNLFFKKNLCIFALHIKNKSKVPKIFGKIFNYLTLFM